MNKKTIYIMSRLKEAMSDFARLVGILCLAVYACFIIGEEPEGED